MPEQTYSFQISQELKKLKGIYCEIDLKGCLLNLISEGDEGRVKTLNLPGTHRGKEGKLQTWGQGIALLQPDNGSFQRLENWTPPSRYGLVLGADGPLVFFPEIPLQSNLIQSHQFVYPGNYPFKNGPGPFDLFASPDQSWLAVVHRLEGRVMIIEVVTGTCLAEHHFASLAGPKLISVALDRARQRVFVTGLDQKEVWVWPLQEQPKAIPGPWKQPSALLLQNHRLWVLESGAPMQLHALALDTLTPEQVSELPGYSYASSTDAPGDLLVGSPDGSWLTLLNRSDRVDPHSAQLCRVEIGTSPLQIKTEALQRIWPVLIAWSMPNPYVASLSTQHPLNNLPFEKMPPAVQALILSCGLDLSKFQSQLIIVKTEEGKTQQLLPGTARSICTEIQKRLLKMYQLKLPEKLMRPEEQEILVHAERLADLLKENHRVVASLYGLLGKATLQLDLLQADYLPTREARGIGDFIAARDAAEAAAKAQKTNALAHLPLNTLPENFTALADPLNNRIAQLDSQLQLSWQLDTHLLGVYRPLSVAWLPNERFVILDGESNDVSCWSPSGRQEWVLQNEDYNWNRAWVLDAGETVQLLLHDKKQGELLQFNAEGNILWSLREQDWCPEEVLDVVPGPAGYFWLLEGKGGLTLFSQEGGPVRFLEVSGQPSMIAASPNGQILAVFDNQQQKLWFVRMDNREPQCIEIARQAERFRISQPLDLQWRNQQEIVLYDAFRILVLNAEQLKVEQALLLQDLKSVPTQQNKAPSAVFEAQAERNLNLRGGQKASLHEMLSRVPLFQQAPEAFLLALRSQVSTRLFNRGDNIVKQGEAGDELFLIRQGKVEVLNKDQRQVVAQMGPGDIFGEVALMLGLPRNATVRAGSYCEVFCLKQTALDALLLDYPDVRDRLFLLAQDRRIQEELRSESDKLKMQERLQNLRAGMKTTARPAPTHSALQIEGLSPLDLWVRHTRFGQMARINRKTEVQTLLGSPQNLLQPVVVLDTPEKRWVLDTALNSLLLLDPSDNQVQTQLQHWGETRLEQPLSLVLAPNTDQEPSMWLTNSGKAQLLQLDSAGNLLQNLEFGRLPVSIDVLSNGHLLVADSRMHTVSEITTAGELCWQYGTPRRCGREENQLFAPESAKRLDNGHTLIADTGNNRVLEVDMEGKIVWALVSGEDLGLPRPSNVFRLPQGNTLIEYSNRFRWLEITSEQVVVWRYTLPAAGF
jgi:CRP-like cAMP-binding protein